jgi:hypothetical protein
MDVQVSVCAAHFSFMDSLPVCHIFFGNSSEKPEIGLGLKFTASVKVVGIFT